MHAHLSEDRDGRESLGSTTRRTRPGGGSASRDCAEDPPGTGWLDCPERRRCDAHRRPWQNLYRCDGGPLVRQRWVRPKGIGPGRGGADRATRLLPYLRGHIEPAPDRTRRPAAWAAARPGGPGKTEQGFLRAFRLRRQRHPNQAGSVLQQSAGAYGKEEDHFTPQCLPRGQPGLCEPDRLTRLSRRLRPSHGGRSLCLDAASLSQRQARRE